MKRVFRALIILFIIFSFDGVFALSRKTVKLDKCVDGDTAVFKIGKEIKKTRFLAINTPESVDPKKVSEPYGKEASNYTCKKLTKAEKIEIQYDPNSEKEDKYGRVLAWIYVDGKLLQNDLVSKGYAEVKYLYADYLYTDQLKEKEMIAKSKKLRIWSDEAVEQRKEIENNSVKTNNIKNQKNDFFDYLEDFLIKIVRKLVKRIKSML
ncbi:MAG: thermonuclease family protein [Bacilli bacterium]|nr:thermonuclease family protein [Bacilli bacterium]